MTHLDADLPLDLVQKLSQVRKRSKYDVCMGVCTFFSNSFCTHVISNVNFIETGYGAGKDAIYIMRER